MKKTKRKIKKIARVVIDDDGLVGEAVRLGGHRTKREAVERALEEFISAQTAVVGLAQLEGATRAKSPALSIAR